jgi:hypothetical protein
MTPTALLAAAGLILAQTLGPSTAAAAPRQNSTASATRPFPAGYRDHDALLAALERLGRDNSDRVRVATLGHSAQGREIPIVRLGRPDTDEELPRPALLIVANLEADHLVGSEVALRVVERLADADDRDADGVLDRLTVYVVPRLNPDGAELLLKGAPRYDQRLSLQPIDRDRDGQSGEDGPDDLDGDGLALTMRVKDHKATLKPDEADPRILKPADTAKGEQAVYSLYREGFDNDGDGLIDEDPPGGVNLNRNWPQKWTDFDPEAGWSPGAEPETRPLIQFLVDHPEVVSVWTFGLNDNLAAEPKKPESTLDEADLPYFADLARRHIRLMGEAANAPDQRVASRPRPVDEPVPLPTERLHPRIPTRPGSASTAIPGLNGTTDGALSEWAYQQRGLFGLASRLWAGPDIPDAPEGQPKPPADGEARWLYWNDKVVGGRAFVPFHEVEHPTLGPVEVGGWKPGVWLNPPAGRLGPIADAQMAFLKDLVGRLPRIELGGVRVRSLGGDVFEVSVEVKNTGVFPTALAQAVKARESRPIVARLRLPEGGRLLAGQPVARIETLAGSGARQELRWTVLAPAGQREATLDIRCPRAGNLRRTIRMEPDERNGR